MLTKNPSQLRGQGRTAEESERASWLLLGLAVIVVIVVVPAVVLSGGGGEEPITDVPLDIDFTNGISLITLYGVDITVSQRLARTVLTMEVSNALNCGEY